MNCEFTYSLSDNQRDAWISFYAKFSHISIMQFPGWFEMYQPNKKVCYCFCKEQDQIVAICAMLENKIIADVYWGPVSDSVAITVNCIEAISDFYRKKYFALLRINLQNEISDLTFEIQSKLKERLDFIQKPGASNWSTLKVGLKSTFDEIEKSFSNNHKRSIKKAQQSGIYVIEIVSKEQILAFANIYIAMHRKREIAMPISNPQYTFPLISEFFNANRNGIIKGVFDSNDTLIGAIALSYEGNKVFYLFGATDYNQRKLPILHLAFYEAIKQAKDLGFEYFDMGGYNHEVDEQNQIYSINTFKCGFGGECVDYPLQILITLNRVSYWAYRLVAILRKGFRK